MAEDLITPLEEQLIEIISHTGPIGIDKFMSIALYDPKKGYYINGNPIGAGGDFITAPEISQMFGEMLAIWVTSCWYFLGCPKNFCLVELGPGRGTLMKDMLRALKKVKGMPPEIYVIFVESNNNLKRAQMDTLDGHKIIWCSNLSEVSKIITDKPVIFIANEFLDCLPIKQFVKINDKWCEKQIGLDKLHNLRIGLSRPIDFTPKDVDPKLPNGSIIEIAPQMEGYVQRIADIIKQNRGFAVFVDYGYDNGETGDSLQALYKHNKISPLEHIGEADITAHVDFYELSKLALKHGLEVEGPASQADFLSALGIEYRAEALQKSNPNKAKTIQSELERLINPEQMGQLFKVMVMKNIADQVR